MVRVSSAETFARVKHVLCTARAARHWLARDLVSATPADLLPWIDLYRRVHILLRREGWDMTRRKSIGFTRDGTAAAQQDAQASRQGKAA